MDTLKDLFLSLGHLSLTLFAVMLFVSLFSFVRVILLPIALVVLAIAVFSYIMYFILSRFDAK
jgi:hypothetical protein